MSWLNLDKIKGEISNFTQAFTEGISEEERTDELETTDPSELEKLRNLCVSQNEEIDLLRKQIFEYQQAKLSELSSHSKLLSGPDSSQRPHSNQNVPLEDSWFWEPEPETSSTSSKRDDNGNDGNEGNESPVSTTNDLTSIPLDSNYAEINEKLRKQLNDKEAKIKSLAVENSILNEKLRNLTSENEELNNNIDELDKQHNSAVEELLEVKNQLQDKFSKLKSQHEQLEVEHEEYKKRIKMVESKNQELHDNLSAQESKNQTLQELIKLKDQELDEVADKSTELEEINRIINSTFKLHEPFESSAKFKESFAIWATKTSTKIRELDFEISKLMDENKLVKEENNRIMHEKEVLKADLINYEIECSELMKNNNILMADIENLKSVGKLETIPENDDEDNIVILEKQLEDSNSLNQSLENEFYDLKEKVLRLENEKQLTLKKIKGLESNLAEVTIKLKESQLDIETLEHEKCNYLFELNELKSADERNILQKELKEYKDKTAEYYDKYEKLKVEHESLAIKYNTLFTESQQKLAEIVMNQEESGRLLQEKQIQLQRASSKLENLEKLGEELTLIKQHNNELQNQIGQLGEQLDASTKEKEELLKKIDELMKVNETNLENLKKSQELIQELQKSMLNTNSDELKQEVLDLREALNQITVERDNLIGLVRGKHEENVNYHNEIVRLNELLTNTTTHSTEKLEELQVIKEKFKKCLQKLEAAEKDLQTEQYQRKYLEKEKLELNEQNQTLNKDIERLRQHLLEVADEYTQQTVDLQKNIDEYKNKLISIEEEAKKSANAYTSANIRANQQAETLQAQYTVLLQQRDDLLKQLSVAEDRESKNQAALTNLQCALELFQKDKDHDVELQTKKYQKELEEARKREENFVQNIQVMQQQLNEAKQGLLAAARLNDQLEMNQATIEKLRKEITEYKQKSELQQKKLEDQLSKNDSTVDAVLLRNLIVGYFCAPNQASKLQILKLISTVLSLSEVECQKIGLKSSSGWFSFGSSGSQSPAGGSSLAEAFVQFLEKESQPRVNANLLTIHENEPETSARRLSVSSTASTPTVESPADIAYPNRNSPSILKDILKDS